MMTRLSLRLTHLILAACVWRPQNVVGECWVFQGSLRPALPAGAGGVAFFWRTEHDPATLEQQQQQQQQQGEPAPGAAPA